MVRGSMGEFIKGLWRENPTFRIVLGLCPTLAVSTSVANGFGMGVAATFVLLGSTIFVSLVRNIVPEKVRIPCYIVIIATFVTIADLHTRAICLLTAYGSTVPGSTERTYQECVKNILDKSGRSDTIDASLFAQDEERRLHAALARMTPEVEEKVARAQFAPALMALAGVRDDVDAFFDKVLVNTEDLAVRANRLALRTGFEFSFI